MLGRVGLLAALVTVGAALAPAWVDAQDAVVEQKAQTLETKAAEQGTKPAPEEKITPAEAQAHDPTGKEPLDDALTCLARTMYWETKGESREAMEAVANVVMNRLGHAPYPDTVCGVVTEGRSQKACQFSWWCDGRPDDVEEPEPYKLAKEIAGKALNKELADRTSGALWFHNTKVRPSWADEYVKTTQLGGHIFYRPKAAASN